MTLRVTVWGENVHEQTNEVVARIYPTGMHQCIADGLNESEALSATAVTLQDPEQLGSPHFPACHRHSPPEEVNKSGIRASASGALLQRG